MGKIKICGKCQKLKGTGMRFMQSCDCKEIKKALLVDIEKTTTFLKEGYGGTLPCGRLVDRRIITDAAPIPKNTFLNVPEPKEINPNE